VIGGYGLLLLWPGFAQTGQAAPEASGAVAAGDATVLAESRPSADLVGSFPGSILIPGTELSIKLGGRIKVDAIHDFGAIGTTDEFKTSSIPVPEVSSDGNTEFHAKDTRLYLDARVPTGVGEVRSYVEGNFFGSGSSFELRHAYLETDRLLAGQTWSNFMLIESRPENLDFEGPDGSVFLRQTQVRWTQAVGERAHLSVALEDPDSDVTSPAGSTPEQVYPDLTAGLLLDRGRGHTYVSAILREVSYDGAASDSVLGWGASVSGKLHTTGEDDFRFQLAYGEGIARYVEDLRGLGLDAAPDASGDLEALPTYGGFLGYRHHWNEALRSSLVHSMAGVDNSSGQGATALHETSYSALNLIWKSPEQLEIGVEVLYGTRENNDGEDADVTRLQLSFMHAF
jgi:hypothetical protein